MPYLSLTASRKLQGMWWLSGEGVGLFDWLVVSLHPSSAKSNTVGPLSKTLNHQSKK